MKWRYAFLAWYVIGFLLMMIYHVPKALQFSNGVFLVLYAFAIIELEVRRTGTFKGMLRYMVPLGVLMFLLEALGTATGFPFGPYHYTNLLGVRFLHVPFTMAFAWMGVLTNVIIMSASESKVRRSVEVGGLVVLLDLLLDPVAESRHFWVWLTNGSYYGVPLQNFVGWFICSVLVSFLFPLQPASFEVRRGARRLYQLMVLMFGCLALKAGFYLTGVLMLIGLAASERSGSLALRQEEPSL